MNSQIPPLTTTDPRIQVGRFTYGNPRFFIWDSNEQIQIGSFCSIAEEVSIFGGGEHRSDWITTFPLRIAFGDELANKDGHPASKGPTVIGNDVWIGYRSVILSGVTIGNGAIIGAGSIVTKDIAPYSIVAGNPAVHIKYRFSEVEVAQLQILRWWDWDLETIHASMGDLCSSEIQKFLHQMEPRKKENE
jgi:acetyltransferase-like isoleucine patch superfamily enzyme